MKCVTLLLSVFITKTMCWLQISCKTQTVQFSYLSIVSPCTVPSGVYCAPCSLYNLVHCTVYIGVQCALCRVQGRVLRYHCKFLISRQYPHTPGNNVHELSFSGSQLSLTKTMALPLCWLDKTNSALLQVHTVHIFVQWSVCSLCSVQCCFLATALARPYHNMIQFQ